MVLLWSKLYFSKDPEGVQHFPGRGGCNAIFYRNPLLEFSRDGGWGWSGPLNSPPSGSTHATGHPESGVPSDRALADSHSWIRSEIEKGEKCSSPTSTSNESGMFCPQTISSPSRLPQRRFPPLPKTFPPGRFAGLYQGWQSTGQYAY